MPNYPERRIRDEYRGRIWMSERRGDVHVHRAWLRVRPEERFVDKALYELTASTMALPSVLKRLGRTDVVICVVPTLLAAALATALPRRPRVVLWVQDLVTLGAGALGLGGIARRAVAAATALERAAVARANHVIACSPGFRDYFVAGGADPGKIDVVYNWVDLEWIEPRPTPTTNERLRVLYAGNLGYSQGLETLIEAARICGDSVNVDIVGDGNAARAVAQLAAGVPNVTVRPSVPRKDFPNLLADNDAHVVIQRRVSAGANLPSKIATYLGSGRPVIASIDPATSAAQLLRDSGGALVVEPESPSELARAMGELAQKPELRRELGANARAFAEAHLGSEAALCRFEQLVLG
jgi:colanic acid biosynthesis glycosyl transferase WcaI